MPHRLIIPASLLLLTVASSRQPQTGTNQSPLLPLLYPSPFGNFTSLAHINIRVAQRHCEAEKEILETTPGPRLLNRFVLGAGEEFHFPSSCHALEKGLNGAGTAHIEWVKESG